MPRLFRFAGVLAAAAMVAMPQSGLSQTSGAFASPAVAGGLAGAAPVESFDEQHFESALNGPPGIQPSDAAAAEARRQGLISDLNVALEEFIDRPTDLLLGGILRSSNDNNIGGTNNP